MSISSSEGADPIGIHITTIVYRGKSEKLAVLLGVYHILLIVVIVSVVVRILVIRRHCWSLMAL
jgi:hypothetical protein